MTTTGSSADIVNRVKQLLPPRWFAWVAPIRDAILGGLADSAAWNYSLITYAKAQTRIATAYGVWLDIVAYDFLGRNLTRNGAADDAFRAVIKATVLQERVTRAGMASAVTMLTGAAPAIFEPWNTNDTGAYSGSRASGAPQYGSMGYGMGRGGWGNMNLPGQAFIKVYRGTPLGVPNVSGWTNKFGGWGVGSIEYTGPQLGVTGITNDMINRVVNMAKPTGSTMWIAISPPSLLKRRPCIFGGPDAAVNSQNIVIV